MSIAARVQARISRGMDEYSAVSHSLAENPTTKAQAAEYARTVYGVDVKKSWTIRQIIVACGTEIAHS